jgi:hypothetical protein
MVRSFTPIVLAGHVQIQHLCGLVQQSDPVDGDRYLLELARYVVLNPVRARVVSDP